MTIDGESGVMRLEQNPSEYEELHKWVCSDSIKTKWKFRMFNPDWFRYMCCDLAGSVG